jgi:carboxypeptidase C (cathepsin A)
MPLMQSSRRRKSRRLSKGASLSTCSPASHEGSSHSIIIGNGWISPAQQYPAYLQFALANGILAPGDDKAKHVQELDRACNASMAGKAPDELSVHINTCESILGDILDSTVQTWVFRPIACSTDPGQR